MDAIERAIRGALEKGNADDRAFREKVYRSVFAALERNIAANPQLGAEAVERRRQALKAKITEIEQEFVPAIEVAPAREAPQPPMDEAPEISPDIPAPDIPAPEISALGIEPERRSARVSTVEERREPSFDATGPMVEPEVHFARDETPEFGDGSPETDFAAGAELGPAADEPPPGRDRPRRGWLGILLIVLLLAALGIGGWLAVELGFVKMPATQQVSSSPPAGEAPGSNQAPTPLGPGAADAAREWVTVFSPANPVSVVAPAGAKADIMDEEGTAFIRVRSGAGGAAVQFDVGQGILERLAGRRAVFDVVARAVDDQETQISIDCAFGALGDCGRRRYVVGPGRADYLFDIDLPAARAGAAGTIAITSDVDKGDKAIDIYEIKVSTSE